MTLNVEQTEIYAKLKSRMVETPDGCWEWSGAKTTAGYGEFKRHGRHHYTHRASWIAHNGPIPAGMFVLHRCDNPPCFRPDHLFLGDDLANTRDKIAKGRMRHGHLYGDDHPARKSPGYLKRGEDHPRARITMEIARDVRRQFASGIRKAHIAKAFGINRGTVHKIVENQQWNECRS
jgi:hypothetical protein